MKESTVYLRPGGGSLYVSLFLGLGVQVPQQEQGNQVAEQLSIKYLTNRFSKQKDLRPPRLKDFNEDHLSSLSVKASSRLCTELTTIHVMFPQGHPQVQKGSFQQPAMVNQAPPLEILQLQRSDQSHGNAIRKRDIYQEAISGFRLCLP